MAKVYLDIYGVQGRVGGTMGEYFVTRITKQNDR